MIHIFKLNDKLNIVDSNNNFVGFDTYQDCCEEWSATITTILDNGDLGIARDLDSVGNIGGILDVEAIETNAHTSDVDAGAGDQNNCIRIPVLLSAGGRKIAVITLSNIHNGWYWHHATLGTVVVNKDYAL